MNLQYLSIVNNGISCVGENTFEGLFNLRHLLLGSNPIHTIASLAFYGLSSLIALNLTRLPIKNMSYESAPNCWSLKYIDLSFTGIQNLSKDYFKNKSLLKHLNLKNTKLRTNGMSSEVFLENMDYIGADDWRFCCLATLVRHCDATMDKMSSCNDLLSNNFLKISIWLPAISSFALNGLVLM